MGITVTDNILRVHFLDLLLEVEPWGHDALRVRATRNANFSQDDGVLLPPKTDQIPEFLVNSDENQELELKTGISDESAIEDQVEAEVIQGGLRLTYHQGRVRFFRTSDGCCLLDTEPLVQCISHAQTITGAFCSQGAGTYRVNLSFKAHEDERFYGLGQHRHGFLNQKGCSLDLAHHNCEINIPFLISSRGYAFIWNNPAVGRVELSRNRSLWVADRTRDMDFVVKASHTPADALRWYADATGHAPKFPSWASGFWQCKLRYKNQDEVMEVAREYRRRKLPLSVIVIDFFNWSHSGDYQFEPEDWPDPQAMVNELKSMGIELMVSNWPTVSIASENFKAFQEEGFLLGREHSPSFHVAFPDHARSTSWEPLALIDPSSERARRGIWEKVREGYGRYGIRAYWLDAIEPELITSSPDLTDIKMNIGNACEKGALYPWFCQKLYHDGLQSDNESEILTLGRSAYLGSQRFGAAIWNGDIASSFEDLRISIRSGLNMAMSGIPWWCTDIGGFHGGNIDSPAFHELLIRWFQYAMFCPIFRLHGDRIQEGKSHGDAPNEIWSFGGDVEFLLSQYLHIREQLRPYVEHHMAIASETGIPPMRPMLVDFPEQKDAWEVEDQFMFGSDLLVAPVTEPHQRSRSVWLPSGKSWKSLWDAKQTHEGGQCIEIEAPLHLAPVMVPENCEMTFTMEPSPSLT